MVSDKGLSIKKFPFPSVLKSSNVPLIYLDTHQGLEKLLLPLGGRNPLEFLYLCYTSNFPVSTVDGEMT